MAQTADAFIRSLVDKNAKHVKHLIMDSLLRTVHTSILFDPTSKHFKKNISIVVDSATGTVQEIIQRPCITADVKVGDIDLWCKASMPGFVDAHVHIFLHAYRCATTLKLITVNVPLSSKCAMRAS